MAALPPGVKRGIDPNWQPEIEELSYSLGIYHVESYTDPGVMHGVDLTANTCTCLAWTRGRRPDCSHRKAARERRAKKQALWQALVALQEEYGAKLFRETAEALV